VIERHPGDVDGEIEVAVDPGLTPNQRVNPHPPAIQTRSNRAV
jgi:hypothetical protein